MARKGYEESFTATAFLGAGGTRQVSASSFGMDALGGGAAGVPAVALAREASFGFDAASLPAVGAFPASAAGTPATGMPFAAVGAGGVALVPYAAGRATSAAAGVAAAAAAAAAAAGGLGGGLTPGAGGVAGSGGIDGVPPVGMVEEDGGTFCVCGRGSFGEMIGCDNDSCERQWFHLACVGLRAAPSGKWFCPDCRQKKAQAKGRR